MAEALAVSIDIREENHEQLPPPRHEEFWVPWCLGGSSLDRFAAISDSSFF
jgi:hypothetical protein